MRDYPVSSYATSPAKFAWEWLVALIIFIPCLPLFALILLCIMCADGRPIFFRQPRVGKNGCLFRIVKFRTMRAAVGPAITSGNDPRITRCGRFLRASKLDELPQLWNVIKGDMALVGPRPEVPQYVSLQSPQWAAVLRVRPGITGTASLRYRDEAALLAKAPDPVSYYGETLLPAKLSLEVRYLQTCSFFGDLRLLWKTGMSCLFAK